MLATEVEQSVQQLNIRQERFIAAPADVVFQLLVEGVGFQSKMILTMEAWPGGRWYRDLGNNTGHLWGHVQVIKPPKLLEITGPMFMSFPVMSHLQYRLSEENGGTKLSLVHQAVGLIPLEMLENVNKGWNEILGDIQKAAEDRAGK